MEKHIKTELHSGGVTFIELCKIAEQLLGANVGSNEFHAEVELFLLHNFTDENVNNIINLIKGLSLYKIQNEDLNQLLFKTISENMDSMSIRQLEMLLWSFSRKHLAHHPQARLKTQLSQMQEYEQQTVVKLIDHIKQKSPSMRPRGIAFAIEAISNLGYDDKAVFDRLERVVIAKIDEFNTHYLVKIMNSYSKVGQGSGELYDSLIH
jgi:hypothetical protein